MRKILFATGLLLLSLSACKKQDVVVNTEPQKPPFRVSGLSDILATLNPFYNSPFIAGQQIEVLYGQGDQKRVTLRMENMPAGMRDTFSVRAGYPDFSTSFAFLNTGLAKGIYTPLLIVEAEDASTSIRLPFTIRVEGDTSCVGYFAGRQYSAGSNCSGSGTGTDYTAFSARIGETDTLVLNNFKGSGLSLKILINCATYTVVVPEQVVGNNVISGTGQLQQFYTQFPTGIAINVSERSSQGGSTSCTYWFQFK